MIWRMVTIANSAAIIVIAIAVVRAHRGLAETRGAVAALVATQDDN